MGCFGKSCLFLVAFGILTVVVIGLGSYLLVSGGSKPEPLPIEELPPAQLSEVRQRVDQFEAMPAPPTPAFTPAPAAEPDATPEPAAPTPPPTERELVLSAGEINGLIAANKKSRGHAYSFDQRQHCQRSDQHRFR